MLASHLNQSEHNLACPNIRSDGTFPIFSQITYIVVSDVLRDIHINNTEAVLYGPVNIGLDHISLAHQSVTSTHSASLGQLTTITLCGASRPVTGSD